MKNLIKSLGSIVVALVFLALAASSTHAADAATSGDLRALIGNAVASGQSRVVIPPGVYRVAPKGNAGEMIMIRGARNLEIVAEGVTMLCTKRMRAIQFDQCENVTLRGLTLDYEPLTFTQGKVVAMAEDKGWLDIQIDAGYPQVLFDRIVICDPKTRFHKYGIDHLWGTKASWAAPGVVRITRPNVAQRVDIGDPVALSGGQEMGNCHGITVENKCSNVVFRNVTIHCAPGMGVVDFDSEVALKMLDCKIVPGPKPAGATEERLLTTSWDGIQSNVARVGAQIENTVIERCGDDSWSVPTRAFRVLRREGKTLVLKLPEYVQEAGGLVAGDSLSYRSGTDTTTAKIQAVKIVKAESDGKTVSAVEVGLEQELPAVTGSYLFNPERSSKGFIYRNNRVYSHGRGALIKVGDGLVEGNTFRGADKAIIVNSELGGGAGIIDRLVIRNNTITETGYHQAMPWSDQAGAICLSSGMGGGKLRSPGVFSDILIEGNTFDRVKGLNLLISSARNVQVKNNRFLNTHTTAPERHNGVDYKLDATAVVEVAQSDGVQFSGNVIQGTGAFAKHTVLVEPNSLNITGLETGVRLATN